MLHEDRLINSVSDLLQFLKSDWIDNKFLWFRGQRDIDWELKPSIARDDLLNKENMLIKRFKQVVSPHLVGPVPQTPWDWIFLMQHHGAPTRLLDWTESPLVGLYFAIVKDAETDAALWCLDPISLNEASKIKYNFELELPAFEADDKILQNYLPERLDPVIELLPIAVIGQRNSPRMIAQSGTFTINHLKNISIDQIGTQKHIWRYIIPKESRKTIREELRLLGYSELKIFPGLDVAGRSVAKELC